MLPISRLESESQLGEIRLQGKFWMMFDFSFICCIMRLVTLPLSSSLSLSLSLSPTISLTLSHSLSHRISL